MSLIEPTLADPLTPQDAWRQAADRVTPIGEYLGAKFLGGLEATRPVQAYELLSQPPRYERNESLMLPGAPDEFGRAPPVDTSDIAMGAPPSPPVSKEAWEQSTNFRPGIEYDPGMTEARAEAKASEHDRQAWRASLIARSDAGAVGQTAGFAAEMAAGALDPTNYLPLLGPAQKAAMVARFGRIGGALLAHGTEAAANTALFEPLQGATALGQGRSYGWQDAATDILTNALGGAVLGTAVGEGARLLGFGHGERTPPPERGEPVPAGTEVPLAEAAPALPPEVGAGIVPRRPGTLPLRVDDLMRRADATSLALDQIDRGEPVDVGKVLANDPALQPSQTGLDEAGGEMGKGIVGGMYDVLHERYSRGETTEAGAPSLILQVAKAIDDRGRPLTREEFPALAADVMTARKAGDGPDFQAAVRGVIDKWAAPEPPTPSFATAAPEPPHPSEAEAGKRAGKTEADPLATFKQDAGLEGYQTPLPGHEPKPEPGSAEAAKAERATPSVPPTAKEKAVASAALPPELAEIEAMRREGSFTPEDERTLAAGEAEAQKAEGYATAYETLAACVLRNAA